LHDVRQIPEIGTIPPEEIQIARRSVSQVDANQCRATAQYERRLNAAEHVEDAGLKLVEPTA